MNSTRPTPPTATPGRRASPPSRPPSSAGRVRHRHGLRREDRRGTRRSPAPGHVGRYGRLHLIGHRAGLDNCRLDAYTCSMTPKKNPNGRRDRSQRDRADAPHLRRGASIRRPGKGHDHQRRIDYVAVRPASHYCFDHKTFGGIVFPTLRRVVGRSPSGPRLSGPNSVLIQITDVSVT
jgi:hypothetical protein